MALNPLFKLDDLPIVYINGDWYYDPDLGELPDYIKVTEEEYEVEKNDNPAFRRVVGSGDRPEDFVEYDDGKYLADRRDKRVYKRIVPTEEQKKENFILFRLEDKYYYCIRQGCFDCKYKDKCNVTPVIIDLKKEFGINQPFLITNGDIANQEPYIATLTSREPMYLATFRNRSLRELELNGYIDFIIGKYFNFDPNTYSEKSHWYWTWLQQFHWNWMELYQFNELINKYKETGDNKYLEEAEDKFLSRWIKEINDLFNEKLKKNAKNQKGES